MLFTGGIVGVVLLLLFVFKISSADVTMLADNVQCVQFGENNLSFFDILGKHL